MKIINVSRAALLAEKAVVAAAFFSRTKGLLGRGAFGPGDGLILKSCQAIHMFFMRFAIDVVFANKKNRVVGLVRGIKPFYLSPFFWRADFAVELPAGTIDASKTQVGDLLEIKE